jgi:hypothetical protein
MFTQKSILAASIVLIGGAAFGTGLGMAQSDIGQTQPARFEIGSDPSFGEVRSRMADQGFDVREVEYDDGKIEVKGLDASGRCMEIYFSPRSGKEVKRERDDDCGRYGSGRSGSDDDRWDDDDDRWDD